MSAHNRLQRLQSILARIKPFNELHRPHQTDINIWKNQHQVYKKHDNIDCDQILRDCLVTLGVPQLEPYLAWIPPDKLDSLEQLAEGRGYVDLSCGIRAAGLEQQHARLWVV